jgi:uncharacterized membrane-anchored protein YitT (DUF2179 family)
MPDKKDFKSRAIKTLWRVFIILIGSIVSAAGMILLLQPHKLLSGGVTGISMLLSYFTPVNAGIWTMAINVPLFVIAWKRIDFNFCFYSILGTVTLSGCMILFNNIDVGMLVSDPLLASLFGGMLSGGGTGMVIRERGSHGGTDIVSVIIRKKFSISIGMVAFYVDLIIVGILSFKFGVELGLLTLFSQFVAAKSLDRVVTGFNTAKAVTIVSDKPEEIAHYIKNRMYRGVTFLEGKGGHGGQKKRVIWCVVTTSQLSRVKAAMQSVDPNAFMAITDASEIVGHGFYSHPF